MKTIFRSCLGILAGFITALSTSMTLLFFSLFIFSGMLTKDAPIDILMTSTGPSTGPLLYALFAVVIALIIGIFTASLIANNYNLINYLSTSIAYGACTYWLSQSPSGQGWSHPKWHILANYLILLPAALLGYFVAKKVNGIR